MHLAPYLVFSLPLLKGWMAPDILCYVSIAQFNFIIEDYRAKGYGSNIINKTDIKGKFQTGLFENVAFMVRFHINEIDLSTAKFNYFTQMSFEGI